MYVTELITQTICEEIVSSGRGIPDKENYSSFKLHQEKKYRERGKDLHRWLLEINWINEEVWETI